MNWLQHVQAQLKVDRLICCECPLRAYAYSGVKNLRIIVAIWPFPLQSARLHGRSQVAIYHFRWDAILDHLTGFQ